MIRLQAVARGAVLTLALHAAVNARLLRRPPAPAPNRLAAEWISVLVPVRNEAHRVRPCLQALAGQDALEDAGVEILVLDDGSTDGTADLVAALCSSVPRLQLIRGSDEPPPGFLGKPWACGRLAAAADPRATVLVFLDADVVLAPDGLARTVTLLRAARLDFVSPYPRQLAASAAERLIQPLLQWSWLTFVPLRLAERSRHPSLALANGQLLAVDAQRYAAAGGHAAAGVRDAVLEDLALARALRRQGCGGGMADGTTIATCRMYDGWSQLREGYTKSLWAAAGGGLAGSIGQLALLSWLYLRPDPVCYAAGVASRIVAAHRTGGRSWPDALAHPVSIALLAMLTLRSWYGRATGTLKWKGRSVPATGS